jgi:two-component system cell cycle sensor histidine kinase/response regulator CckA
LGLYFLLKIKNSPSFLAFSVISAALITAVMIELMILSFGGHQSVYYAGMIVVLAFILGFLPISVRMASGVAISVYAIYLLPILFFDKIINVRVFINNNMFLLAAALGGVCWRYFNQKLLVQTLSLQYDLAEKSRDLEVYTLQLESMVENRTKELNKSVQWHQALFESATDGIVVTDLQGTILNANERACEMHGFSKEALIGIHSSLLEVDEHRHKAAGRMQQILAGESLTFETTHFKKDGTRISLEVSAKAIPIADELYIQAFLRDITEKKKIQEHLFQSQKMDSIGMLAGGIAHDFNNILTAIIGYIAIIRKDVGTNQKVLSKLSIVENAARKASRLVSQLLGFARKSEFEIVTLNVNDIASDAAKLAERLLDKRVQLQLQLAENLPFVEGDFNKLEQVIMNLAVNARDAMPYGGSITLSTCLLETGSGTTDVPPYVRPGAYVALAVTDTGVGIPEAIQRKIFEPFFTTKERGKGTGLGLAMAYGVVNEHKGYLLVKSAVNVGTTFTILLPASLKPGRITRPMPASVRGTETVLLVDDDATVIDAVKESLEVNGYKVMATTSPQSALDAFKRLHRDIALVVTDIDMPMIDGRDLLQEMMVISPSMRFLTMSAFSEHEAAMLGERPDVFLQKPFETHELLDKVRKVIDGDKRAPARES